MNLRLIENYEATKSASQALSKDIFLFQCYTGQRISDVIGLKKKNIKISKDSSDMEWELYQEKGNKRHAVYIYILDSARNILNKYLIGKDHDDFIFPRQSPVITNRNLKKIGKAAGLTEVITKVNYSGKTRKELSMPKYHFLTTHIGRKTFTTLLSSGNMSDHEIQSMTGHSSSKEMRPYKGIDKEKVKEGLKRCFENVITKDRINEYHQTPTSWGQT